MFLIKRALKRIINSLGFHLIPTVDNFDTRYQLINNLKIKDVIDVGANLGDYGKELLSKGYPGNLYSFEPISHTFNALSKVAQENTRWKVFQCALSNNISSQEMYKANLSPCSSLLWNETKHKNAKKEVVKVITFDEWVKNENLVLNNYWLKIDVEGYEKFVLEGCKENLSKASVVDLELSAISRFYYDDIRYESSLTNIIDYMNQHNFSVLHIDNLAHEKAKCFFTSIDVIFIRNDLKTQLKDLF